MDTGCIFDLFRFETDISNVIESKENIPALFRLKTNEGPVFVSGDEESNFIANICRFSSYLMGLYVEEGILHGISISENKRMSGKVNLYFSGNDCNVSFRFLANPDYYISRIFLDGGLFVPEGSNIILPSLEIAKYVLNKSSKHSSNSSKLSYAGSE